MPGSMPTDSMEWTAAYSLKNEILHVHKKESPALTAGLRSQSSDAGDFFDQLL